MRPPDTIETQRLRLRRPTLDDVDFIYAYASMEDVAQYMMWRRHENSRQTRLFLERCNKVWEEETAFPWVIEEQQSNKPLGMIELQLAGHMASMGYVLSKEHWGQGYMTEAVIALRDWSLAQPSIFRFWSYGDVDNHASRRVMEKAGMQFEGILHRWVIHPNISDTPRDAFCCAIVK